MKNIYKKTRPMRDVLESIVGTTTVKTFFSYYAIFTDGLLFGLYKDGNVYLRMPQKSANTALLSHLEPLNDPQYGIHDKNFYHIPDSILFTDIDSYAHLIKESLKEIALQKKLSNQKRKQMIRYMPNLNINIERRLKRLGIYSIDDLIEKGVFHIYAELIKSGVDADQTFLFKLYGAIHRQYIYTMSDQLKKAILKEANQVLYDVGLRKRFKIDE